MKKNWISTLCGQIAGILSAYLTTNGDMLSLKGFLAYAGPALLGLVMKDWNTTGVGDTATKGN